jgi:hypothetical protein
MARVSIRKRTDRNSNFYVYITNAQAQLREPNATSQIPPSAYSNVIREMGISRLVTSMGDVRKTKCCVLLVSLTRAVKWRLNRQSRELFATDAKPYNTFYINSTWKFQRKKYLTSITLKALKEQEHLYYRSIKLDGGTTLRCHLQFPLLVKATSQSLYYDPIFHEITITLIYTGCPGGICQTSGGCSLL